jgi:tRNA-2-methylthio-N6-dimethylallyladenosine synthase
VRGKARSRPHEDILKEVECLMDKGVKEVILLGQSVNQYKDDGVDFSKLLCLINEVGMPWIKFITSHPKYMSDELIEVMHTCKNVCEWLHLPLQAGSNRILKQMNRGYTREEYMRWIYEVRKAIPDVVITTDIMVGFPSEDESEFNETLEVVREVGFDFAYMFKYSDRKRTASFNMKPKVEESIKAHRLTKLISLQNEITSRKNASLVGTEQEVLILGKSKKGGELWGKTRQNKVVIVEGNASPGDFVTVLIKRIQGWTPYGEVKNFRR